MGFAILIAFDCPECRCTVATHEEASVGSHVASLESRRDGGILTDRHQIRVDGDHTAARVTDKSRQDPLERIPFLAAARDVVIGFTALSSVPHQPPSYDSGGSYA